MRTLLKDDALLNSIALDVFREYNMEQMVAVSLPESSGQVCLRVVMRTHTRSDYEHTSCFMKRKGERKTLSNLVRSGVLTAWVLAMGRAASVRQLASDRQESFVFPF